MGELMLEASASSAPYVIAGTHPSRRCGDMNPEFAKKLSVCTLMVIDLAR